MKRFHIAIGARDVKQSVDDYSARLGCEPSLVVPDEYALWRTNQLNFSIRKVHEATGLLRHLGWEDPSAPAFGECVDVNGIVWEQFTAEQQSAEIAQTWPDFKVAT